MKNSKLLAQELQEVITRHTEQGDNSPDFPYKVILASDGKDNVKITVNWPISSPAQTVHTLSSILHHTTDGDWMSPLVDAVKKNGVENNEEEVANQILQTWAEKAQMTRSETPCVSPQQVFARTQLSE